MALLIRMRRIYILVLVMIMLTLTFPHFSSALRPLNDEDLSVNSPALKDEKTESISGTHLQPMNSDQLDEHSPALVAPPKVTISKKESHRKMDQEFENSICFKRCHKSGDFYPSDKTAKQWRLLIEQEGHTIFSVIPWESPQEKEDILSYLLNNARNSRPGSAGIGVW